MARVGHRSLERKERPSQVVQENRIRTNNEEEEVRIHKEKEILLINVHPQKD